VLNRTRQEPTEGGADTEAGSHVEQG
jgi:hypothetical protein